MSDMLVKLSRGRFYFDRRRVAAARRPCRRCCWSSWWSASARRCRARRAAGASTPRWRTSSCCSAFSTSRGGATGPAAAIIILQLACHPGVLAAVSPGLHVHLRAPHPPDLMGGIFLYGGTTGIMPCLIFDHFKYFLENNIFQHYNVWFISSIYFPYVMVHIYMYIGNGDLCPGVLYIASGPSSCRNRSQRIAALPVLIFYFEYSCSTLFTMIIL